MVRCPCLIFPHVSDKINATMYVMACPVANDTVTAIHMISPLPRLIPLSFLGEMIDVAYIKAQYLSAIR